jgi:hypothetical protein
MSQESEGVKPLYFSGRGKSAVEALENLKENAYREVVADIRKTDVIRLQVGELEIAAFAMKVNPAAGCGCGCGDSGGGGGGG